MQREIIDPGIGSVFGHLPEKYLKAAKDRLLSGNLKLSKGIKVAGTELRLKESAEFQRLWWRAALSEALRMFLQSSKHKG